MSRNVILFILIVAVALAAVAGYFFIYKKSPITLPQAVSPNILYLTNPVTSFSGKVDSVNGNNFTVSQDMVLPQTGTAATLTTPSQNTNLPTKKITYQITLTDKTIISQTGGNVPYLLKKNGSGPATPSATTSQLSGKDLKAGQFVTVTTATDLRTLIGNQFEATTVQVSSDVKVLNGQITNISGNKITVMGVISVNAGSGVISNIQLTEQKEYMVTADQNTEISTTGSALPGAVSQPQKLSISDLKKDLQIMIYAQGDINQLIALRIIPAAIIAPTPQATQSGTQQPK